MHTRIDQEQTVETAFSMVLSALARTVRKVRAGKAGDSDIERLSQVLETLPLPFDEYTFA
ncbi:hypothetical protein Poly41_71480 [Novipirellula artificiosorum]|uniref:Uncharacterized protein n=1 Tax=Novipirellula artificiosorum TaxID=2528016 RepID=A0A5C6CEK8_9BACT|nr:hypothetical protein Poly41_71480 [Novipirellula artificiosorum]